MHCYIYLTGILCLLTHNTSGVMGAERSNPATEAKVSAQAKPIVETKHGPITLRVIRARWATSKEIGSIGANTKALTVWLDATSSDPKVQPATNLALADYVLAAWLTGPNGDRRKAYPVEAVRSIHRSELPYVPGKAQPGQSTWRWDGADPRWPTMRLEFEYMLPGAPYTRKDIPKSILEPSKPETDWLKRIVIDLPTDRIELGTLTKSDTPPIAKANTDTLAGTLIRWIRYPSTFTRTTPGSDESVKQTVQRYSAYVLLKPVKPGQKVPTWGLRWSLQDEAGRDYNAMLRHDQDAQSWSPDGAPLGAGEVMLQVIGEAPHDQPLPRTLILTVTPASTRMYEYKAEAKDIRLPAVGQETDLHLLDQAQGNTAQKRVTLMRMRRFDAAHPLPGARETDKGLPPAGLAVLLKLNPVDVNNRIAPFGLVSRDNTGVDLAPQGRPVIPAIRRDLLQAKPMPGLWLTLILAPPAPDAQTCNFSVRVQESIQDETTQPLIFELPLPELLETKSPTVNKPQ